MPAKKSRFRLPEKEERELLVQQYRQKLRAQAEEFHREFKRHLALFITGAFSFVAALLWNGAINKMITRYQNAILAYLPFLPKEPYVIDLGAAFVVTILAVIVVITINKVLK
jgi:hypothetical protein